ncbi:class I SAM-dependent methyltransferase [Salaquimonas pukyongi]|uniref:class I SAM-dependent methyltransferase n=1 Tax=Salaquimonas pukyongi TaxID=2712698 RepID=UPI00096BBAD6|nr:class I SAM-dependent methyltransferase [Salaquimonas pukyongi]
MLAQIKKTTAALPLVGPILRWVHQKITGKKIIEFKSSDQYWEDRYRAGRTSGSGSYGRLAQFKADFLNDFVEKNDIKSIVEFGCGDGAQLTLAKYPNYIGFDVSPAAIRLCKELFSKRPEFSFHTVQSEAFNALKPVDLALSLDVIYHLIEEDVFESYMEKLFNSSRRFIIIYAYDFEKNYRSKHEKGRKFTKWIESNAPKWKLTDRVPNKYPYSLSDPENTSQSDFFIYKKGE